MFETRKLDVIRKHVFGQTHFDASGLNVFVYQPQPTEYDCCFTTCHFSSKSYDDIIEHVTASHNNLKSYNEVQYQGRNFSCVACCKGYDTWYQVLNHKSRRSSAIYCKYCGRSKQKSDITSHQEKCPMRIKVSCDICGKDFESERLLKTHKKNYHKPEKKSKGQICSVCGLIFTNVTTHMLTHLDYRPFKCSFCPARFKSKVALDNHGTVHTKVKAFACRYGCDNRYGHSGDRYRHERAVHMNIKPFSCLECSKSFGRERELRLHLRMHTGRKLYPCDRCKDSFDKLSELKEHECSKKV